MKYLNRRTALQQLAAFTGAASAFATGAGTTRAQEASSKAAAPASTFTFYWDQDITVGTREPKGFGRIIGYIRLPQSASPNLCLYPIGFAADNNPSPGEKNCDKDSPGFDLHTAHNGFVVDDRSHRPFIITKLTYDHISVDVPIWISNDENRPKTPAQQPTSWERIKLAQNTSEHTAFGGILNCKKEVLYVVHGGRNVKLRSIELTF